MRRLGIFILPLLLAGGASGPSADPVPAPSEIARSTGGGSDALSRVASLLIGEELVSGGAYRKLA